VEKKQHRSYDSTILARSVKQNRYDAYDDLGCSGGIFRQLINVFSVDSPQLTQKQVINQLKPNMYLLPCFLNSNYSHSCQQGEATHIIHLVRPYIDHILISKLEAVKSE
jgi:hypothetical protein